MTSKFVVGYDGSPASRRAADFAVERAKTQGASIIIAHVLEWSPYSFLTPEELEERHKRRSEELARAEAAVVTPLLTALADTGIEVDSIIRYGHIADTLGAIARDVDATQIFVGRDGSSAISARVFGSVAGSLAQSAPVACTIVP
ncbi:MAG: universal stress protein [Pseudomonadota bacterium]